MIVVVTGSSGTGKTVVARAIAKKYKLKYIDLGFLIKKNRLYEYYDKNLETHVVDVKKLNKYLIKLITENKNLVIDSHLSHYLDKKYVDLCIVVKCNLKILKKRLGKKGYNNEKLMENLDAEIFDTCLIEALEKGHKVKVIDTSKGLNKKELKREL